jgi:hypothetical protein
MIKQLFSLFNHRVDGFAEIEDARVFANRGTSNGVPDF